MWTQFRPHLPLKSTALNTRYRLLICYDDDVQILSNQSIQSDGCNEAILTFTCWRPKSVPMTTILALQFNQTLNFFIPYMFIIFVQFLVFFVVQFLQVATLIAMFGNSFTGIVYSLCFFPVVLVTICVSHVCCVPMEELKFWIHKRNILTEIFWEKI